MLAVGAEEVCPVIAASTGNAYTVLVVYIGSEGVALTVVAVCAEEEYAVLEVGAEGVAYVALAESADEVAYVVVALGAEVVTYAVMQWAYVQKELHVLCLQYKQELRMLYLN